VSSGKRAKYGNGRTPNLYNLRRYLPLGGQSAPNGGPGLARRWVARTVWDLPEEPGAVRGVKPSDRSNPPRPPRHYRRHTTDELHEPNHGATGFRAGYLPR